jgi:hypothetical protein
MSEIIRLIGTRKMFERGNKYYRATVCLGTGFLFRSYKLLHKQFKTKTKAVDYAERFISTWVRLHPEVKPRAKKVSRFS